MEVEGDEFVGSELEVPCPFFGKWGFWACRDITLHSPSSVNWRSHVSASESRSPLTGIIVLPFLHPHFTSATLAPLTQRRVVH